MLKSQTKKPIPTPNRLVSTFFKETLATAAGVKVGRRSIAELGELSSDRRHCDIHDDLWSFFNSLKPKRRSGDFQMVAMLPRPRPLQLHVEPYAFYGHFRAWLRKRGVDPDTIDIGDHKEDQE